MLRIFGHFIPAGTVVLGTLEAVLFALALHVGMATFVDVGGTQDSAAVMWMPIALAAIVLISMHTSGLYSIDTMVDVRQTVLRGAIILCTVTVLAFVATSDFGVYRTVDEANRMRCLLLIPAIWFACFCLTRTIFSRVSRTGVLRRRVLILGQGTRASQLRELAKERFGAYFLAVAQVGLNDREQGVPAGGVQVRERVGTLDLLSLVRQVRATEVVIATEDRRGLPVHQLLECKLAGIRVTDYPDFYERESGRVDLGAIRPSWFIFSDGFRMGVMVEAVKRVFDVSVALITLVLVLPLLVLSIVAIKVEGGGGILYRQERVGLRGRNFMLFKLRSMTENAERDGAPVWAAKSDPRVTRVGWIIRKLRIDELPQLYNVLRGDMSFVGPRPERPYFVDNLAKNIPFYSERHSMKPGITGWAQVNYPYGASLDDAKHKLSYDLYYLKNRGLFLDLIILIRTFRVVLWPEGAR
jgi:sugar transferase (PEP-CTERM system associated)